MPKKKPFLITFEGIEGSGKSYQSKKLYKKLKKMNLPVVYTREPGGTHSAEKIRKVILDDYFHPDNKEKFNKYTDTLLYLASRNEHIVSKIRPALLKGKIVICDRFIDSTLAYQVYGKGVNKDLVDLIHKFILGRIRPNLTFILKVNISKAMQRVKKRKNKNRYDKFPRKFYEKVQRSFIKLAKIHRKRCAIYDNSKDSKITENDIYNKFLGAINK